MKSTHLVPALIAILLVTVMLLGGVIYAQSLERRYVHALATLRLDLNLQGSALQKEAFRQPDLLPVYGSSETTDYSTDYSAQEFFRAYPTGFATFEVGGGGMSCLNIAQQIAAIGPDIRGKKVIISFTPTMFQKEMVITEEYAFLFSRLHANELIFSPYLSLAVKQAAAQRMLAYPTTLDKEPLLHFTLDKLAHDSLFNRALYYLVWPLGRLWTLVLELQDHWETTKLIWAQGDLMPVVTRQPAAIDWPALVAKAEQEQIPYANNNPFGFDNKIWLKKFSDQIMYKSPDADGVVMAQLQQSAEWIDLEILLQVLKELDAQPLLLSRPINATYWEEMGVTAAARQTYYNKLRQLAASYNIPVVDFQEHEYDKYFSIDSVSHTSRKGWVYVNKTLDDFYHGILR